MATAARAQDHDEDSRPRKITLTAYIDAVVAEEVRNAVDTMSGPPSRMTLARFVEEALIVHLARYRKSHNSGRPWPARPPGITLKRGRPQKPR